MFTASGKRSRPALIKRYATALAGEQSFDAAEKIQSATVASSDTLLRFTNFLFDSNVFSLFLVLHMISH